VPGFFISGDPKMALPLAPHANKYKFGRGKIYVDLFDDAGALQGERFLGNCPGFTLTVASDKFEHFSSTTATRKKDLSVTTQVNFSGSIQCDDVQNENLALFLAGSVETVTQSATPVTAEMRDVLTGYEYQLGATALNPMGVRKVSSVTVKDEAGSTTYVAGEDYTVDADSARVYIIPGGDISDGDTIQFGYTPTAGTKTRISTTESGGLTGAVRFIADNAFGENQNCYIASATLAANGDLPFITENDLASFTLDIGVNEKDSSTPSIIIDGELVTA
jgi:hypothetical protein